MAGVTYERLEGYKTLQWPVAVDGSDQPLLYTKEFYFPDGKAKLFPVSWKEPTDQQDGSTTCTLTMEGSSNTFTKAT